MSVILLSVLVALLAVGLGLWAARARRRRRILRSRAAAIPYSDSYPAAGSDTYPDIPHGRVSPGEGELERYGHRDEIGYHEGTGACEPLGHWDGLQWESLCGRLFDLTRDFLGNVVPRPGRATKVDIQDPGVAWVIDGLLGAGELMVGASGDEEPQALAAAIREVELRWLVVRNRPSSAPEAGACGGSRLTIRRRVPRLVPHMPPWRLGKLGRSGRRRGPSRPPEHAACHGINS